ncbi:MAG: hypothetical protein DRI90_25150, partial [Deltaproteobacteria bacterium]
MRWVTGIAALGVVAAVVGGACDGDEESDEVPVDRGANAPEPRLCTRSCVHSSTCIHPTEGTTS